ncbi:MAG: HIT domain-containing protein [Bryobacteraceae bacterium]
MDYLWSPWRYQYVTTADKTAECIFCDAAGRCDDRENLIVWRGARCFVILNRYPYTSGHLMVVPYAHVATLEELDDETTVEMARTVRAASGHLRRLYSPDGMNVGMNIGKCAGAGVAGHVHAHVLPRWVGDSSFMTTVGETRVLPEDLATTWRRLTTEMWAA